MKRLFIWMITIITLFQIIIPVPSAASEVMAASVIFGGEQPIMSGIDNIIADKSCFADNVGISGDLVRRINVSVANEPKMYIDIADDVGNSYDDGSSFETEITYYDKGNGYFAVWYDKIGYGAQLVKVVYLTDTNKKLTEKIRLEDAAFNGGIDGKGDLMLSLSETGCYNYSRSPSDLYLKSIKIKKYIAQNPILCEAYISEPGNTFSDYEEDKIVKNTFTNTTNLKKNIEVKYTLCDESGAVFFEKNEMFSVGAKSNVVRNVNIETNRCGLYIWNITITYDNDNISHFKEDTVCIVKSDPNGILSDFAYINFHADRYPENRTREALEMIKKANIGGLRLEVLWSEVETVKSDPDTEEGVYSFNNTRAYRVMTYLDEMGIPYWILLNGGNNLYDCPGIPKTDEQRKAYRKYVKYISKTLAAKTDLFEVWNEPDMESNNPTGATPFDIAKITQITREEATKYNPKIKVSGLSITGLNDDKRRTEWLIPSLAAGITNNGMNMLAVHTYAPDIEPEKAKIYNIVKQYKNEIANAENYPIDDIPVLISEYGNSSTDPNTSDDDKANWIVRAGILYRAYGIGNRIAQYNFEKKGVLDIEREDNFGMVSIPREKYNIEGKICIPSKSYLMYAAMNYILGGKVSLKNTISDPCDNIKINRFYSAKFQKDIIALWSVGGEKTVKLDLGADSAEVFDAFGNAEKPVLNGDTLTVKLGESPTYIMGIFPKNKPIVCDAEDNFDDYSNEIETEELRGWESKYYIGNSGGSVASVDFGGLNKTAVRIKSSEITLNTNSGDITRQCLLGFGRGISLNLADENQYIFGCDIYSENWSGSQTEALFYLTNNKSFTITKSDGTVQNGTPYSPSVGLRITDGKVYRFEPSNDNLWQVKEISSSKFSALENKTRYRFDIIFDKSNNMIRYCINGECVYSEISDRLDCSVPNICFAGRSESNFGIVFDNISCGEYNPNPHIIKSGFVSQDGTDITESGGDVYRAFARTMNIECADKSAMLVQCAYKSGLLTDIRCTPFTFKNAYTTEYGNVMNDSDEYDKISVFVFDDTDSIKPLYKESVMHKNQLP